MSQQPYVAVEGPIGVGKTTLARVLAAELDASLALEAVEENPFLAHFYREPEVYAFQTQAFFLLSRWRQQRELAEAGILERRAAVADYLLAKDRIFAGLTLKGLELDLHGRIFSLLEQVIPTPSLVVYLQADTQLLLERIALRDRPFERQMSADYLQRVRRAYEAFFATYRAAPVLAVDTNRLNLVSDGQAAAEILGRVRSALQHGVHQRALPDWP